MKKEKTKQVVKMDKAKTAAIVLAVLLVIAIGYILGSKYQESQAQKQLEIYQQGAQFGYQQAIVQLLQQASTCQQVPVTYQNTTINMIAVECLSGK